jgi:hypothetical protein
LQAEVELVGVSGGFLAVNFKREDKDETDIEIGVVVIGGGGDVDVGVL